jgi:hypothetical protein
MKKGKIARRLRTKPTMTRHLIAERWAMAAAGYAAQCLREAKKGDRHPFLRD